MIKKNWFERNAYWVLPASMLILPFISSTVGNYGANKLWKYEQEIRVKSLDENQKDLKSKVMSNEGEMKSNYKEFQVYKEIDDKRGVSQDKDIEYLKQKVYHRNNR